MSAYENLAPAVRDIVDRKTAEHVAEHGGNYEATRDAIAAGVYAARGNGSTGTGH